MSLNELNYRYSDVITLEIYHKIWCSICTGNIVKGQTCRRAKDADHKFAKAKDAKATFSQPYM